jgi:uncharacterized protein YjbI with pentapeptide repeats/predicted Ser/Thr protein kinase
VTRRQWERISQIFNEAVKLHPSLRSAYLEQACADAAIRAEVESLLTHNTMEPLMGVYPSFDGVVLGHYRMIEPIGHGSMGQVYKAEDEILGRIVAAKLLVPWVTGVPGFRERLLHEAKCASALDHPNIVIVHEIVSEQGVDFIAMEYVQGNTLQQLISGVEIADALETAHAAGILHGDLKPLNIMVSESKRIKLLDFGLARALTPDLASSAQPSMQFGTRAYMAPECLTNRLKDERSEMFAFGLILYQMLCGKHPFAHGTPEDIPTAIQSEEPATLPPRIPAYLSKVVYRCLEKNPNKRFESIQDVLVELENCEDEHADQNPQPRVLATLASPIDKIDVDQAIAITAQINYANAVRSRNALEALQRVLRTGVPPAVRDAVSGALREVILTVEPDTNGVPRSIRDIRKETLDILKLAARRNLRPVFSDANLESIDLYGMDFSDTKLAGLRFRESFLAHADFSRADLTGCSLARSRLRNARFHDAVMAGVDLTGADWFNAIGLTERRWPQ